MFDVEKVQRMTDELEKFARTHEEIYLTLETLTGDMLALFHQLEINFRAIMVDDPSKQIEVNENFYKNSLHEEFSRFPMLTTSEAAKIFSERTGIIVIVKKPLPFFQTELPFVVNNRRMNVPTFILTPDEISAIYNRLTIHQIVQRYAEDGLSVNHAMVKLFQGLKTFLNPESQTLKFQFWDETYFNFRYELADTAIVIQGPLVYENNYTAATLKLYRKIYPNAPIVVSTWTGEATAEFREICRENSVVLLENVPPKFPGIYNVNMQLESSLQGVNFVRENTSAKFVLKTRCDQRINKPDFLTYFKNLILTFPPLGDKLHGRIILLEASKWLPFRTADFLAFGYVEDIFKLYCIKHHCGENNALVKRKKHERRFSGLQMLMHQNLTFHNDTPTATTKKLRQFNNVMIRIHEIESHILKTFYEENIAPIDCNKFLETGWKFMRDYFVIVGCFDVLLDWPKYESDWQYELRPIYTGIGFEIDFSRWLDLYRNFKLDWV